jgi:uncharacterized Zn finger protein
MAFRRRWDRIRAARGEWPDYVTAAERQQQRARTLAELRARRADLSPVELDGRAIARTFWGKAWCENLERYSDFANRLPRGRSYVRSGAVVDLQIAPGRVTALVAGTALYSVEVDVAAVPPQQWAALCRDCAGAIESVVALLQGTLPEAVLARLFERDTGLFPAPRAIAFRCSCPDRAAMCKHVAAVLYGIGSRLDRQPELLFTLRRVDQQALVAGAGAGLGRTARKPDARKLLDERDLSALFDIDIVTARPRPSRVGRCPRSAPAASHRRRSR